MSQDEVISILKGKKGWFNSKQIHFLLNEKEVDISFPSVQTNLRKLRKSNLLKFERTDKNYLYKFLNG